MNNEIDPGLVAAGDQRRAEMATEAAAIAAYHEGLKEGGLPDVLAGGLTAAYADLYWRARFGIESCGCG